MAGQTEFTVWASEELAPLGPIRIKAMFGGFGLYAGGLFFAIIVDDQLYLKTDQETRPRFEAAGSEPFRYGRRNGKTIALSYFAVPDSALDDARELLEWARLALAAAGRARRTGKTGRESEAAGGA